MPTPRYEIRDFSSGLVSPVSPYGRPHVRDLTNCWLSPDDWGAIEPMPGFARYGTGASPIVSAYTLHVGFDETAGSFAGSVYISGKPSGAGDTLWKSDYTVIKTGITALGLVSAQIRNNLVFVNGTDAPFQVDLNTDAATDVGVTRIDSTNASTSSNPGGKNQVRGVVRYWISEMSTTTEGALSLTFGEIDCGDGDRVDVDLTNSDFWNKTIRIYRTLQDGNEPFLVAQIDDTGGAGTTYTDDIPDSELVVVPYLHGDPPPSGLISVITQFGRLWGITEDGILYWSDLIDHESWWTASNGNWTPVYDGDGDKATGLALAPDGLYVFKDHHIYHVYAQNISQMQITPITLAGAGQRSIGAPDQTAIATTRRGIAFYHDANVYFLAGTNPIPIADAISEDLRSLTQANEESIVIGHSERYNQLWLSVPTQSKCYIYDFQRRRWIGTYGYYFLDFAEVGEAFLGCGGAGATDQEKDAHTLYSGLTDSNGDDIAPSCEISPVYGSNPAADKLFHAVELLFDRQSSNSDITLTAIFDSDGSNPVTATVAMDEAANTQDRLRRRVNLGIRARELTLKVSSTAASPQWKIYEMIPSWHEYGVSSRRA